MILVVAPLEALERVKFSSPTKPLLQSDQMQLLYAAVNSFRRHRTAWQSDLCLLERDGEGVSHLREELDDEKLALLFHGGPGTGKTSAAHFVAEYTHRPLMLLNHAKIGYDPAQLQAQLKWAFGLAQAWGCAVLLEDADAYLNERKKQNEDKNLVTSKVISSCEHKK